MTYRIAVLDDEAAELRKTKEMLLHYAKEHPDYELEISCFTDTKTLTEAVCGGLKDWEHAFHILIMDINPQGGAAMESVRHLRKQGFENIIIFLSPTAQHAIEAYEVVATHYLIMSLGQNEFEKAMNRAIEKLSHLHFLYEMGTTQP